MEPVVLLPSGLERPVQVALLQLDAVKLLLLLDLDLVGPLVKLNGLLLDPVKEVTEVKRMHCAHRANSNESC